MTVDRRWNAVTAGLRHSVALRTDGVWAWGWNSSGQLGLAPQQGVPSNEDRFSPGLVETNTDWLMIAPGGRHTLGVRSDGTLWAWGSNDAGQLGTGKKADERAPIRIGAGTNWIIVAAGEFHSIGLQRNGTLWVWGKNSSGQLGNFTTADEQAPIQVDNGTNWVAIAAGRTHTLGMKSDGSLWSWGDWEGNTGDQAAMDRLVPRRVDK